MKNLKVIETDDEAKKILSQLKSKFLIAFPIFCDNLRHYMNNVVSVLFIYDTISRELYVFGINHNELPSLSYSILSELDVGSEGRLFVSSKKEFLSFYIGKPDSVVDVSALEYINRGEITNFHSFEPSSLTQMRNFYWESSNLNQSIPFMKLLEWFEKFISFLYSDVVCHWDCWGGPNDVYWEPLQKEMLTLYSVIEQSGLHVDDKLLLKYFGEKSLDNVVETLYGKHFLYTNYYPYTITSRPSNAFGGINFAALNKNDGSRSAFTSRFRNLGELVLIDFESFHLRLIADMADIPSPKSPFHEFLGKLYFNTQTLTQEQYEEGKQRTFSMLYGERKSTNIDFFNIVYDMIDEKWEEAQSKGYIETSKGRRIKLDKIADISKSKMFNYLLQAKEAETATELMYPLINLYKNKQSKLILYTYDSLLIDHHINEPELINLTVNALTQDGKYPVRVYKGPNYHELTKIS